MTFKINELHSTGGFSVDLVELSFVTLIPLAGAGSFAGPSVASTDFFMVDLDFSASIPLGGPITAAFPSGRGFAINGFISAVLYARIILDLGDLERLGRFSFAFLSFMKLGTAKKPGSFPAFYLISSSNSFSASILSFSSTITSSIFASKSSSANAAFSSVFLFL